MTPEEQLLADLDAHDAEAGNENAALQAAASATQAAIATAGDEYNAQIAAADEAASGILETYNGLVATAQTKQESAAAAADAVTAPDDVTGQIASITPILTPTVASNDQADIQAAIDAIVSQLNDRIGLIKGVLTDLNNPDAIEGLKTAATDLAASTGAIIAGAMPVAADTQPEVDEFFSLIAGLRQ